LAVVAVLMVVGTESLRRQVASEFPDEQTDAHSRGPQVRRRVSQGLSRMHAGSRRAYANHDTPNGGPISGSEVALIQQLADLRDRDALTDEEFAQVKRDILRS
jgi:putative oligomerization/nucleic acid binding protein